DVKDDFCDFSVAISVVAALSWVRRLVFSAFRASRLSGSVKFGSARGALLMYTSFRVPTPGTQTCGMYRQPAASAPFQVRRSVASAPVLLGHWMPVGASGMRFRVGCPSGLHPVIWNMLIGGTPGPSGMLAPGAGNFVTVFSVLTG